MLTVVLVFLLLLIALLAIPVSLTFKVSWQQVFQGDIQLCWAFGLVRLQLSPFPSNTPSPEGEPPAQKTSHPEPSSGKIKKHFGAILQKAFRQRIIRFLSDFWHAIQKRDICLRIRAGLGDPADTGQLWAIVGPVAGMLSNAQEASIEIVPEFFDATLELDSSGNIRLIPLQIIYLTIGLLLSPPIWRGFKQMRKVEK